MLLDIVDRKAEYSDLEKALFNLSGMSARLWAIVSNKITSINDIEEFDELVSKSEILMNKVTEEIMVRELLFEVDYETT